MSAYTGTLGEEIHRVFCQRFADEAYPNDVTGGLTAALCRGTEAPSATEEPHLRAIVDQRTRVVSALDTMLPEDTHSELFDLLAAMLPLYDDGTLPGSTRAIADVNLAIEADPESVAAFARFSHRQGYRPMQFGLGLARPALRYPALRDVVSNSLGALAPGGVGRDPFLELLRGGALELATFEPNTDPAPTTATLARNLVLSENAAFASGTARLAVVRDLRGIAMPVGVSGTGSVPAPYVDTDGDHLPDVDSLGRFVDSNGAPIALPAPFAIDGEAGVERDAEGRALLNGALVYQYRDLDRTMLAGLVREGATWFDPADPTLVELARALPVMMGTPGSRTRAYGSAQLTYPGFDPATGPTYDLLHGALAVLHRQETVDGLRVLEDLMTNHESVAADLIETGLYADGRADLHPEAALVQPNVFWDDLVAELERMSQIRPAGQPSMLEGVTRAFGTTAAADLDEIIALYATHRDAISFDGTNFANNGGNFNNPIPAGPLTNPVDRAQTDADPQNESLLQRSVYLIRDLDGVQYCNKEGAELILRVGNLNINVNASLSWTGLVPRYFAACELLQIDNVAKAYAQSTWGGYEMRLKGVTQSLIDLIRGLPGGAGLSDNLLEATTGITGMGSFPTAPAMARFVFGYHNDNLKALVGELRARDGALIEDRHCLGRPAGNRTTPCPNAVIFAWEKQVTLSDGRSVSFLEALRPVLQAMDARESGPNEFFFGSISNALHMHYPSRAATRTQRTNPNVNGPAVTGYAYQDDIRSYEPLFAEVFQNGHLIRRLGAAVNTADAFTVRAGVDGVDALTALMELVLDPTMSCVGNCATGSLRYRDGTNFITYNDGRAMDGTGGRPLRHPSPLYLLLDAISGADDAWIGQDARHDSWLTARGKLVDQFFTTEVVSNNRRFANRRGHNILLLALPFIRQRIEAHRTGANLAAQNQAGRDWAAERETKLTELLDGPVVAGLVRLLDALDQDAAARDSLLGLLSELMNEAQSPEGTAATLYAASDALAVLDDDPSIIPILNTLSVALATNAQTVVAGGGDVNADSAVAARTIDLLARTDALDTTGVLSRVLANSAVHPATGNPITPIESLMEAIAEVNRATPGEGGPVAGDDVVAILDALVEFLTSADRGLERLYAVIENRKVQP